MYLRHVVWRVRLAKEVINTQDEQEQSRIVEIEILLKIKD